MLRTTDDARFWDRIARKYATDKIMDTVGYERTLERTRKCLSSSDTVLEIGCGTGTTALKLAPSVSRILASDVSNEMIAIAREKAIAQSCLNAEFAVARAEQMVGSEDAYDAVLAFNVLHLIGDRQSTLANICRLLKPGGLFFCRLASTVGAEHLVRKLHDRWYALADGSERYLVDEAMLMRVTEELGAELVDPIKTTVVQNLRSMTTWVLRK